MAGKSLIAQLAFDNSGPGLDFNMAVLHQSLTHSTRLTLCAGTISEEDHLSLIAQRVSPAPTKTFKIFVGRKPAQPVKNPTNRH
jgi:hypothetical protein